MKRLSTLFFALALSSSALAHAGLSIDSLRDKPITCTNKDSAIRFTIAAKDVVFTQNQGTAANDLVLNSKHRILSTGPASVKFEISIFSNFDGAGNLDFDDSSGSLIGRFYGYNTNDGHETTDSFFNEMECAVGSN